MIRILGKRNYTNDDEFLQVWNNIEHYISREEVRAFEDDALDFMARHIGNRNVGYAWSGGKDSLVVGHLCQRMGINRGMCACTKELEFKHFDNWLAKHTPRGVDVMREPFTWRWLVQNPKWLFPSEIDASNAFNAIAHQKSQRLWCARNDIDGLIVGRRIADQNYCPSSGILHREDYDTLYPIRNWPHEAVLGYIHYHGLSMPPVYFHLNGFNEGPHPWFQRLAFDLDDGWAQVFSIESDIVIKAAKLFPSAAQFLANPHVPVPRRYYQDGRVLPVQEEATH